MQRHGVVLRFTSMGERSLDLDQVHGHVRHGRALQTLPMTAVVPEARIISACRNGGSAGSSGT